MNRLRPRRRLLAFAIGLLTARLGASARADPASRRRWYEAAVAMRELALSWGDQPYGAVLVRDGRIIGHGPSRVVRLGDPDAHAEREAIRDALRSLGPGATRGAELVSTSRPCPRCEAAAACAGITRLVFGPDLQDAGAPRERCPDEPAAPALPDRHPPSAP